MSENKQGKVSKSWIHPNPISEDWDDTPKSKELHSSWKSQTLRDWELEKFCAQKLQYNEYTLFDNEQSQLWRGIDKEPTTVEPITHTYTKLK